MIRLFLILICGFLISGIASAAPWATPPSYSAKITTGEQRKNEGRMYRTPGGYRHELRGGKEVVMLNLDSNLASVLLPGSFALEIDFKKGGFSLKGLLSGAILNPVAEGPEAVNNQPSTRYRVELSQPPVAAFKGHVWVTRDGIIMRIRGEGNFGGQAGRVEVEASDIQRGPQPASLFELGPDARRLKMDAKSAAQFLLMMSGK